VLIIGDEIGFLFAKGDVAVPNPTYVKWNWMLPSSVVRNYCQIRWI